MPYDSVLALPWAELVAIVWESQQIEDDGADVTQVRMLEALLGAMGGR